MIPLWKISLLKAPKNRKCVHFQPFKKRKNQLTYLITHIPLIRRGCKCLASHPLKLHNLPEVHMEFNWCLRIMSWTIRNSWCVSMDIRSIQRSLHKLRASSHPASWPCKYFTQWNRRSINIETFYSEKMTPCCFLPLVIDHNPGYKSQPG